MKGRERGGKRENVVTEIQMTSNGLISTSDRESEREGEWESASERAGERERASESETWK